MAIAPRRRRSTNAPCSRRELRIPFRNENGADQTITFPEIPDVTAGTNVGEAPRDVERGRAGVLLRPRRPGRGRRHEGKLTFTPIPPRAKFPVKVTVVAWQWGRSIEPKLKIGRAARADVRDHDG